jgi:hypothetical protein
LVKIGLAHGSHPDQLLRMGVVSFIEARHPADCLVVLGQELRVIVPVGQFRSENTNQKPPICFALDPATDAASGLIHEFDWHHAPPLQSFQQHHQSKTTCESNHSNHSPLYALPDFSLPPMPLNGGTDYVDCFLAAEFAFCLPFAVSEELLPLGLEFNI